MVVLSFAQTSLGMWILPSVYETEPWKYVFVSTAWTIYCFVVVYAPTGTIILSKHMSDDRLLA